MGPGGRLHEWGQHAEDRSRQRSGGEEGGLGVAVSSCPECAEGSAGPHWALLSPLAAASLSCVPVPHGAEGLAWVPPHLPDP